jgi:hypothetical protein
MSIGRDQGSRGLTPISIGDPNAVQSWPFKEPEKKSAWKPEELKAPAGNGAPVPIFARDDELRKAQAFEAELEANMSPPGALHLPDKLEAARLKWKITDRAFERMPTFDRIHVVQVDLMKLLREGDESAYFPGTTILRPGLTVRKEEEGCHMGILIGAGLSAMDKLLSHGIEVGDVVGYVKLAPFRHTYFVGEHGHSYYLVMNVGDITCDETLGRDVIQGRVKIRDEGGEDGYCHQIAGKKKRSVFATDHW